MEDTGESAAEYRKNLHCPYFFLMHLICHTDVLLSYLASYKPFLGSVNTTLHKHYIFFYSRKFIKKYLGAAEYQ